jgi:hypothetical protein
MVEARWTTALPRQPRQCECGSDGAGTDRAKQHAVERRSAADLVAS